MPELDALAYVLIEKQYDDEEIFSFHPEFALLMKLIKNSNTSSFKEEFFLSELISNASNALDKIKYESFTDPSKLGSCKDLCIKIIPNKDDKTLTIIDTGIGMTKSDLIKDPCGLAKSATQVFKKFLQQSSFIHTSYAYGLNNNVGFYSVYFVADKVTITSKHNDDEQYTWESSADGTFSIRPDHGEPLGRGMKIVLYLKNDKEIYLEEWKIKEVIKKCCHFIGYPIKLVVQKEREKEVTDHETVKQTNGDQQGLFSSLAGFFKLSVTESPLNEPKVEDIDVEKKIKEKYTEEEKLDNTEPLWMRNPDDIRQEEYSQFFESLTGGSTGYLAVKHFSVEEQLKFRAMLFIPKQISSDCYIANPIKLYARRTFIMDIENLNAEYLRFICGVVECEDLPLNISREMLLQNKTLIKGILNHLKEKCLELLHEFAEDKDMYKQFYEQFSQKLQLEMYINCNRKFIQKFLRFYTSVSGDEYCSLQEYVSRMKENQKSIYFISGENKDQLTNSPFVERVIKHGFEVIYLTKYKDDFFSHLKEIDGKTLMCLMNEDLELPEDEEAKKKFEEDKVKFENLCKVMKDVLDTKVEKVVISKRLEASPCCIIRDDNMYFRFPSLRIEKVNRYLEINPNHPVMENLRQKADVDQNDKRVKEIVILLFEAALQSCYFVTDPFPFASHIYHNMELSLGIHEEKVA